MSDLSARFDFRNLKKSGAVRFLRRMVFGLLGVAGLLWFVWQIEFFNSWRGIESRRATGLSSGAMESYNQPMPMKGFATKVRMAQAPVARKGYLIARTVTIHLSVRNFAGARDTVDRIVKAYDGYIANMTISNPMDASQSLSANVAIPAAQCDAALEELKKLGRVEEERQSSEEVTEQSGGLDIRLRNSREAESRLNDILRMKTDKVGDVLQVEKETARVREEIEQMEAEQKGLNNRVTFASIELNLTEEYQSQLGTGRSSIWFQVRNALVDGYRGAANGLVGVLVFLLSAGPSLIVWGAILFWPARWIWLRWRKTHPNFAAGA